MHFNRCTNDRRCQFVLSHLLSPSCHPFAKLRSSASPRLRVYVPSYVLLTRSGGGAENRGGAQKIFDHTSMNISQSEIASGVSIR